MAEFPDPTEGIVLTHFIIASDVDRARRFYADGHLIEVGQTTGLPAPG